MNLIKVRLILIVLIILPVFSSFICADQLGVTTAGSTAYPTQGLRRVGKVVLGSDNYQGLYGAGIDTVNSYAYFGGRKGSFSKISLANFTEESTITLASGGNFGNILVDTVNGFAYFQSGGLHKVKLNGPGLPPFDEGVFNASSTPKDAMLDDSNPDPAQHYAYFISFGSPAIVYKYLLPSAAAGDAAMPTIVGAGLTLNSPVFPPAGASEIYGTIDAAGGYLYLAGYNMTQIARVALNGGGAPGEAGVISTTDSFPGGVWYSYGRPSIDPINHYAYFGTYSPSSITPIPANVDKINLATFSEVSNTTLHSGPACNGINATEQSLSSSVEDPASGYTIFSTDGIFPMKLFKIKNNPGDAPPAENPGPPLLLYGGVDVPPCDGYPGASDDSTDNGVTFPFGEVYAQGSVIDNAKGYAYIGCDSSPGQIIKIAFSQKAAMKATKITVSQSGPVSDIDFYSQSAAGNLRLAIYDDSSPKNLLWDSGILADNVSDGWITRNISSGVPASLTLAPGTYWLCWQTDSTLDVPGYTAGSLGDGFLIDMPFGAYPATLSGVSSTAETWSEYINYAPSGGTATQTPTITATFTMTPNWTQTITPTNTISPAATASPAEGGIIVYPNPYNPDAAINGEMRFKNVPEGALIVIYTISGEKWPG